MFWKDFLSLFLQKFLEFALPLLVTFLMGLIVAGIKKLWAEYQAHTSATTQAILSEAAKYAVQAAEQLGLSGKVKDKKNEAIKIAQEYLVANGFKNIDLAVLDDVIEATVFSQLNQFKK